MSVISEQPKVSIWLSCPSIPGRWWRHRCGTEREKLQWAVDKQRGAAVGICMLNPGVKELWFLEAPWIHWLPNDHIKHIALCKREMYGNVAFIPKNPNFAVQEHRSGLRVRDLVAAHAVAKGWTANSALFVFFRPFQTTTSGAGRFSLLRFWKLVVLETRGSWICPKSHCQQNHQHYFKMLKAFQWFLPTEFLGTYSILFVVICDGRNGNNMEQQCPSC